MKKLKVLIVAWYYAPRVGGVETVSRIIAKCLVKAGHEISVLTSSIKKEACMLDGCKIIKTPLLFAENSKFEKYFSEFLDLGNFDIVHAHNISYPFNIKNSMSIINMCNKKCVPVIEHAHNAQFKTPEKTSEIIHSNLNKIICVSDFVKKRLLSLGVSEEKLVTVPNPLSEELFDPRKIKSADVQQMRKNIGVSDEVVVFFPARVIRVSTLEIGEQKQFRTLVDALAIVKKNGLSFKLVFPGMKNQPAASVKSIRDGEKVVKNLLESKGLGDDVFIFENGLQLNDMPLAYAASDIVCMPSLNESFGMIFLEGQAMGKPIVAARSGAAPYIINDQKTGILVPEKNAKELAKALEMLMLDKKRRTCMGVAGREMVVKKFSSDKILKRIEDIYSDFV